MAVRSRSVGRADLGASLHANADVTAEVRVSDLAEVARRHVGASLPHGWLDGRLSAIGWQRVTLDGHAIEGRAGPHARCAVYRGVLPAAEQPVTT